MSPDRDGQRRGLSVLALGGLVALAAALRSLGVGNVFLSDGTVVFGNSDAFYHARRGLYGTAHFPDFLRRDFCINFPDGATVPHAPGYDFFVAALVQLGGGTLEVFEAVAAWLPVLLGAASVLPVYAIGRVYGGRALGLGAAALLAVLPIAINYSRVGNADHHAAAALLGATLLALYAAILADRGGERRRPYLFFGLALVRTVMLLVWHGSLLYLAVGELVLFSCASLMGRREWLVGQAWSCVLTALLVAPVVAQLALPRDGPYSATELSRLPVLLLLVGAGVCAAQVALQRSARGADPRARAIAALGLGVVAAGLLLAVPGVREGLRPALEFVTKTDAWGASVLEQLPLFHERGELRRSAGERWLGGIAYLLPLIPLAFVSRLDDSRTRASALLAIVWSLVFGVLAFSQVRYANDYAAVGSVGAALLVVEASRWLASRTRPGAYRFFLVVGSLLLVAPLWPRFFAPAVASAAAVDPAVDRALLTLQGTQLRFAEGLRALTPESGGCALEADRPDYGILAHPAIGHVLHYVARRATPADPFGPYIGQQNFDRMRAAFAAHSEDELLRIAETLGTPYLLTAEDGSEGDPDTVVARLHADDGSATESAVQLGHFRLLQEGPAGGVSLAVYFQGVVEPTSSPYKLFEIVPGAQLEISALPGTLASALISVRASSGRRFAYRAVGTADASGLARIRVPYATDGSAPGATRGSYTVIAGDRRFAVEVSEQAVQAGLVIAVGR